MIDAPLPPPPTPRILEAPPADAREVTQPLTAEARAVPASHAGNEKTLAPLTYADSAGAPVPVTSAPVPVVPVTTAPVAPVETSAPSAVRPPVPGALGVPGVVAAQPVIIDTEGAVGPGPVPDSVFNVTPAAPPRDTPSAPVPPVPAIIAPPEAYQPAASNSESPGRGVMRHDPDPLHRPTGGFGPAPSTEYHALNGAEVREVVFKLLDEIAAQIPNDLRFSHALTYPRIECRVTVDVVTYPPEGAVRITKIAPEPKGQAPREVALARADECCFVVMAERREQDAQGHPVDPPDKLRDEVNLPRPHKHLVGTGQSRQLVDRDSPRTHDVAGNPLAPDGTPIITPVAPPRHAVSGAGGQPRVSPGPVEPPPRPATGGPG